MSVPRRAHHSDHSAERDTLSDHEHSRPAVPHRCHRAERCATAEKTEGPRGAPVLLGAPIVTARGLCLTCHRVVAEAISALPQDWVELSLRLGDTVPPGMEMTRATPEPRCPLAMSTLALMERMVGESTRLAEPVAERLRVTWDSEAVDRHTRPGPALQRATRLLSAAMPVLLALPALPRLEWSLGWGEYGQARDWVDRDGLDGALELLDCHRLARVHLRKNRLIHRLPEPCPKCDRHALTRWDGTGEVSCAWCCARWVEGEADYDRLGCVVAVDADVIGAVCVPATAS